MFVVCLIGFLISVPTVILYSQGYRIDWKTRKITLTGGVYFSVLPKSANVYIDNKFVKKTDQIFGSVLIQNLNPGQYLVEIKKPGLFTWQKNLEVKPQKVTEAENIILFPEKTDFGLISNQVQDFYPSPDGKKAILKKTDSLGWYLTIYDLEKNLEQIIAKQKDINKSAGGNASFLDLIWSEDEKKIIAKTAANEKQTVFLINPEDKNPVLSPLAGSQIWEKIAFDSTNSQKLFFLDNNSLMQMDLATKKTVLISDNILDFLVDKNKLYFLDNTGFISSMETSIVSKPRQLFPVSLEIKPEIPYSFFLARKNLFVSEGNSLLRYDPKTESFLKITDNALGFSLSPDNKKIVYFNKAEIWLYFVDQDLKQPIRKQGDNVFLVRFADPLSQVFWLDNRYLILNAGKILKIMETDERDKPNSVDLGEFETPKIFYSFQTKKASVLTKGKFFVSDEILP